MSDLHRIKANLYPNALREDANNYVARVIAERSLSLAEVCQSAVERGGAKTSSDELERHVRIFLKEMAYLLCDGFAVNAEYFTATTLIKGVFDTINEKFNTDKHSIQFQFNQAETLRKMLADVEVEILGLADISTYIAQVIDIKTGSINQFLTPNRNLHIKGSKLKLMGDNAMVGIYFINRDTQTEYKVDASDVAINKPSELMIIIPDMPNGQYNLKILNQYTSHAPLKEPRSILFDYDLTVLR